jgi:cytochrome c-type biogenesis protein
LTPDAPVENRTAHPAASSVGRRASGVPALWQAAGGAAWLVGLWWVGRTLSISAGHAHGAVSILAAFGLGAAVMGMPCVLQMSAVCVALLAGAPLDDLVGGVRRAGRPALLTPLARFAAGYLTVLLGASLVLALVVWSLGVHGLPSILNGVGLATLGLLGLALLGALPFPGRPCAGVFGFLRRVSASSPAGLGRSFALYCAACCGPMLLPLAPLGASAPWRAVALPAAFGVGVGLPFLLVVVAAGWAARTAEAMMAHAPAWRRACGAALLAMALLGTMARP